MTALGRLSRQAVLSAFQGRRVECSPDQYPAIRKFLVRAVQVLVDDGDEDTAELVMVEVLRLDGVHGIPESAA